MDQSEKLEELRREIAEGLASGPSETGLFADMAHEFRQEWEAEQAPAKRPD